jgi:prepilin-type N-terminal cleavage/methylation domain-containing protein
MGEDGFTLIELLIVMIILPIVIGGVTVAIITSLQDQQGLSGQLENSSGAQGASAFFVRDVQSATTITVPSVPGCGSSLGTQVLVLQWTAGGSAITVSYEYTSGAQPSLVRSFCAAGASESDSYLSLDLDPAHPPTATVTVCPTAGTCQQETSGVWNAGGVNPIDTVELTATYAGGGSIFSVTATPRKWSAPPGGHPVPALLVTGSGAPTLSDSATGKVVVNGPLIVNSSLGGSIVMNQTGNLTTSNNNPIYVADVPPSGAVQGSGSGSVNPPPSYSPPTPDPLSALVPPSQPPAGSCTDDPVAQIDTCLPGVYPSTLTAPANGDAVTFTSGVYYLADGMNLSGSGNVTDTPSASSSGVLFYVAGGAITFPTPANVNLTSLLNYPQYPNPQSVIIWQASMAVGDSVTLSGGGTGGSTYSGTVYAPDEEVNFVGTRLKVMGAVVANSASFSQSRRVTIG